MDNTANTQKEATGQSKRTDVIDIGGILHNYLRHWWLFVLSLAVCVGMAWFYMHKKSPVYLNSGMIMVNQQEDGGVGQAGGMAAALMTSMGFGSTTGANPENEQMKMTSHTMLMRLIKELGLNYSYWQDNGFFSRRTNFYHDSPITVSYPEQMLDTLSVTTQFRLEGPAKGPWTLTVKQKKKTVLETEVNKLPYSAKTPVGSFFIQATEHFPRTGDINLCASCAANASVVEWLKQNLAVSYISNKADALQVDMGDPIPARGCDIVNSVMDLYNQGRDSDRIAYNQSQLDFIDNRLLSLYHELEASESKIENYKKNHKVVSAEAEAEYIFTRKGAMDEGSVELQASIQVMEMIRQMLSSPDTKYSLIPFSGGANGLGEGYAKLIESYNDLVLQRMNLAASAKSGNNLLTKLDEQIEAMRHNILSSVSRELQGARINLKALQAEQSKGNNRMTEIPSMEHELITLYRDREVQNAIYGFLLQKREETQIALSQSQPVGKIIDRAYTYPEPASPNGKVIYGLGLVFGLGLPAVFLQLRRRKK